MRTSKQYVEKLQRMRSNVYMDGEKVPRDHDAFMPGIKLMGLTLDLETDPEWEDLLTATSHITGKRTNRFAIFTRVMKI